MSADAAEVLAEAETEWVRKGGTHGMPVERIIAALAAAAADGSLTAEVECPRCWGKPAAEVMPCARCGDTGTVRVVVHLADPALAEMLNRDVQILDLLGRQYRHDAPEHAERLATAARIVGGDTDA